MKRLRSFRVWLWARTHARNAEIHARTRLPRDLRTRKTRKSEPRVETPPTSRTIIWRADPIWECDAINQRYSCRHTHTVRVCINTCITRKATPMPTCAANSAPLSTSDLPCVPPQPQIAYPPAAQIVCQSLGMSRPLAQSSHVRSGKHGLVAHAHVRVSC